MKARVAFAVIAAIGLSGCATIVQGSKQTMSVNTTPVDGAKCELKNATGTWYLTSPGSVEVHKTKTDLEIACSKDGVGSGKVIAKAKFGGTTFGNVLAGGVVGVVVDAASGANFYYDSPVTVALKPESASPATTLGATTETAKVASPTHQTKPADQAKTADRAKPADTASPAAADKSPDAGSPAKPAGDTAAPTATNK